MELVPDENSGRLGLHGPPDEGWWEVDYGCGRAQVLAADAADARAKVEAQLRDLGMIPGGPPGLHESYLRMPESARRGRR
ncbi:MAG TPA: hypothetical protein VH299_02065 [Solirubrobacterales bacterium]|nr:hypothetical protein [Solirubrobacterales bacterium]